MERPEEEEEMVISETDEIDQLKDQLHSYEHQLNTYQT